MNKSNLSEQNKFMPLVCNLLPGKCRFETLEGREHIVVPMVMMTEGVHHGSGGAYLYNKEELSKTPQSWNYKPVVVYHPEKNGRGISACDPTVINSRKIGVIMNTRFDTNQNRLVAEAWVEKSRADEVDDRIMAAVERNEMMELSTGVFVDLDKSDSGEWNGEQYVGVARNFRADHLAVLPDKIGACSIADGAGFLRNAAKTNDGPKMEKLKAVLKELGLTVNEMSFSNIQGTLQDALRTRFNVNTDKGPWLWIENVYSNFVIYEYDSKLFRLGYTAGATGVTLSEDQPVEVVRVTEYRTVEGAFVGNRDQTKKVTMDANQKKVIIDALIANQASGWSETDRPALEAMKDNHLQGLEKAYAKPEEKPAPAAPAAPATVVAPTAPAAPAAPAHNEAKPFNFQEWMAQAPAPVQEFVGNGIRIQNDAKAKVVTALLANKNNRFSKEALDGKSLGELEDLAALAGSGTTISGNGMPNYMGQAPTANASIKEEPMGLPTMNFAAK